MQAPNVTFRAFHAVLTAALLLATVTSGAAAGTWLSVRPDANAAALPRAPQVVVGWYDDSGLEAAVDLTGLELALEETPGGRFVKVSWPEAALAGRIGAPALPVARRLFVTGPDATIDLKVNEGDAMVIDLAAAGFAAPVAPMQARIGLPPGTLEQPRFDYDDRAYVADERLPAERVTITKAGIVRGHPLYLLEVRPVAYNPARGTLTVWPHIEVGISFPDGCGCTGDLGPTAPADGALLNPPPKTNGRRGSNYLIIVADPYDGTTPMNQFISAKTAQGYNVMTHAVAPGTGNTVIKSYIQGLWGTPDAPDYILLVGEGNQIASWIGGGAKHSSTDLYYACMDGASDWYPDIAIGRFSVRTETDLQNAVDKTLYIEAGVFGDPTFLQRAAFLAGLDYDCGDEDTHNWVISTYLDPEGFTSDRLYMRTYGADPNDVRDSFNAGCLYGNFYGHAWDDAWQDGPRFTQADVQGLNDGALCVLLLHYTCEMGAFHRFGECFAETWLRVPNKGAVVNIGATNYVYYGEGVWEETSDLEKFTYDAIYLDELHEVSPLWQGALSYLLGKWGPSHPPVRDYYEMFNVLGDPSLRLPIGPGPDFDLSAVPESQNICAPADAVYTIQVEQIEGFSLPVTLSASGEPPGTTVNFSVNPVTPPGTSLMTISNTGAAPSGEYNVEVTGTAASTQRSTFVGLHVATGLPGPVTLTSPPNGATDVSLAPTLSWQASSQAAEYDLQIATDAGFANVVYSATVPGPSHTVETPLAWNTLYYWHVQAVNGCGNSGYSTPFTFTTFERPDYFTEQFIGGGDAFDLEYHSVEFIPDGSDDFYEVCFSTISELPTDPSSGTVISLREDDFEFILLDFSQTVQLYNYSYTGFYVCANGYITFNDGDDTWIETLEDHFSMRRISALFNDLSPPSGGTISWEQLADRAVVTYENVPEFNTANSNTFQIEMFYYPGVPGRIRISWLGVDSDDCIVGLSPGEGLPGDFVESDLSESERCCPGDLDGDGYIGLSDLAALLANYGDTGCTYEQGDIDGDGDVDLSDLAALLAVYGTVCD